MKQPRIKAGPHILLAEHSGRVKHKVSHESWKRRKLLDSHSKTDPQSRAAL